jgi:DNA-binding beta-propeller fold protein YncE
VKRLAALCLLLLALLPVAAARSEPPPLLTWWYTQRVAGMDLDGEGRLYAARYSAVNVCVWSASGDPLGCWGTDCPDVWCVTGPSDVALDGHGRLYVAEQGRRSMVQSGLQVFTVDGTYLTSFGAAGHGEGKIGEATGVAMGPEGDIYLMDYGNRTVHVFAPDGAVRRAWAAEGFGIDIDKAGIVHIVAEWDHMLRQFTPTGELVREWGGRGSGPGEFDSPHGVSVDPSGNIYVADTYNHRIQVFTHDGRYLTEWGGFGSAPGQMYRPMGVLVDDAYNVYVADSWNGRIQKFGPVPTAAAKTTWGRLKALYR